jgi:outer membrane protein TolC
MRLSAVGYRLSGYRLLVVGLAGLGGAHSLAAQHELTLKQAVDLAQKQGHQASAAASTRDAARYRDRAFFSRRLPQFSLTGTLPSYNRAIVPVDQPDGTTLFRPRDQTRTSLGLLMEQVLPVTGGSFFIASDLEKRSVSGASSFTTWSSTPVTFGIRQDIFRPNVAAWDKREEVIRAELAERQYLEAREDIAVQTATAFFDVYAARVNLETQTKNAAVNDTLYTLNKGRFEVGKIGENDLLQSELALLRSRNTLDGARLEFDRANAALRLALNLPNDAPVEIAVTGEVPDLVADTTIAVAQALRNRASVYDVSLQDVQARRRITEARLNGGMGATVVASYGYNATGAERRLVYQDLLEARALTMSVQIPLMQWGARGENVRAAEAERDRTVSLGQSTMEQTAQEAHFAALQLAQAGRNVALSAKADTVAGKRFEVALNRYVIGRIFIDNLYVAQAEKDQARAQFVQALRGYWQAYYRLRRLTLFDFEAGQPIR